MEFTILIDLQELLRHVIVEAIIHDKVDANADRLIEKTFFCKRVWFQKAPLK